MPRQMCPHKSNKKRKNTKPKAKNNFSEEQRYENKTPKIRLRTSKDVMDRIKWNRELDINTSRVYIGYTDHVLGDQEMILDDFVPINNGGDIPMHHIMYIRYGHIRLWDRATRLDRLFGSGNTDPSQLWTAIRGSIQDDEKETHVDPDIEMTVAYPNGRIQQVSKRTNPTCQVILDEKEETHQITLLDCCNFPLTYFGIRYEHLPEVLEHGLSCSIPRPIETRETSVEHEVMVHFNLEFCVQRGIGFVQTGNQIVTEGVNQVFPSSLFTRIADSASGTIVWESDNTFVVDNLEELDQRVQRQLQTNLSSLTKSLPQKWSSIFPRYPVESDGFVKSFDMNDVDQWMDCLQSYGLVVIKAFDEDTCNKTISALFEEVNARACILRGARKVMDVNVNEPSTWVQSNWPLDGKFLADRPAFHRQAFLNRFAMYDVFRAIFGRDDLSCSIENWGIQRGTRGLQWRDPNTGALLFPRKVNKPSWRKNLRPHWDVNPWKYVEGRNGSDRFRRYQGGLAISEQRVEDGCHLSLPGCIHFLEQWCSQVESPYVDAKRHNIHRSDPIVKFMQPIPLRKGEIVIWDSGTLHGNTKNFSDRMRLTQYIRMSPAIEEYDVVDHYSACAIQKRYQGELDLESVLRGDLNEFVRKVLRMASYSDNNVTGSVD